MASLGPRNDRLRRHGGIRRWTLSPSEARLWTTRCTPRARLGDRTQRSPRRRRPLPAAAMAGRRAASWSSTTRAMTGRRARYVPVSRCDRCDPASRSSRDSRGKIGSALAPFATKDPSRHDPGGNRRTAEVPRWAPIWNASDPSTAWLHGRTLPRQQRVGRQAFLREDAQALAVAALTEAAHAAARTKGMYLAEKYRRMKGKRGHK